MKRLPLWRRPYGARRILEIGPGHNPFKGATHLLEMDVHEGRERGGNALQVPDAAKLIVGKADTLPFEAGTFDYVYASMCSNMSKSLSGPAGKFCGLEKPGISRRRLRFSNRGWLCGTRRRRSTGFTGGSCSRRSQTG